MNGTKTIGRTMIRYALRLLHRVDMSQVDVSWLMT